MVIRRWGILVSNINIERYFDEENDGVRDKNNSETNDGVGDLFLSRLDFSFVTTGCEPTETTKEEVDDKG